MNESSFLILGASNVGKTALLASFFYAVRALRQKDFLFDMRWQPQNEPTREIARNAVRFLQQGQLPFQGTSSIVEYEFLLELVESKRRFFALQKNTILSRFRFIDAPGGAFFTNDEEEIDYAVMGEHRHRLISELKTAKGLIICVDLSELNAPTQTRCHGGLMYNQLADIFSHAPALDGKKQAMSYLSVERVFIALNKCDLWAVQEGFRGEAQEELQKRSPFMLFHELLGDGMINTLRTWLAPTTKIAIGCTSSFGFIDGGPNAPLMNGVSFGPDLRAEEIGAWQPYQVFDPFLFLASGKRTSSNVVQCTVEELDSKVG